MKVVLYARVSSPKQAEKELPIAAQLKTMRKYASEHGWEVCRDFVEGGESARSANRPAFREMIALARQREKPFDAILVWKLSRFARNREDSIIYKSLLRKYGISVISINEQIDDSPAGKLLEGIIEVIDEFYSSNLAQDTVRGMKENAGRGFLNGGSIPTGYKAKKVMDRSNERTQLETDEVFAPIIQRIFRMAVEGMGAKEIVKVLNSEGLKTSRGKPWSKNNVYYILKNEVYTGTLLWNRSNRNGGRRKPNEPDEVIRIESNHPALIDQETFKRVQELLRQRSPKVVHPRLVSSQYLLTGFIYCGKCGARMVGAAAKSSKFFYYVCHNCYKRGKEICDAGFINKDRLEAFIVERVKANILTDENLEELARLTNEDMREARGEYAERLELIDVQLQDLRGRLHKLYDALETGKLDLEELAPRIKELKAQIGDLERNRTDLVDKLRDTRLELVNASAVKAYVEDLRALLANACLVEQKALLRSLIKRIEVNLPQVAIDYTFPLPTRDREPLTAEVLSFAQSGSPGRTRTYNLPVNSRVL
jgi:site-specific DNA recombinase